MLSGQVAPKELATLSLDCHENIRFHVIRDRRLRTVAEDATAPGPSMQILIGTLPFRLCRSTGITIVAGFDAAGCDASHFQP